MTWGLAFWVVLFYPVWSPRMRRIRRKKYEVSGNAGIPVSRMFTRVDEHGEYVPHFDIDVEGEPGTGPAWEQDRPYPELFEEEETDG